LETAVQTVDVDPVAADSKR